MTHVELVGGPPLPPPATCPHTDMHIQTDGDYTKRVVTPFGTTRLKMVECPSILLDFLNHARLPLAVNHPRGGCQPISCPIGCQLPHTPH